MFYKYCDAKCCRSDTKERANHIHELAVRITDLDNEVARRQAIIDHHDAEIQHHERAIEAHKRSYEFKE